MQTNPVFAPPRSQDGTAAANLRTQWAEAVLSHLLSAFRAGTLSEAMRLRPTLAKRAAGRWLRPVFGTIGKSPEDREAYCEALGLFLTWLVVELRPDRVSSLSNIDSEAWLRRTSWRPMLAVATHYGLLAVPEFSGRYRRGPAESAADNLCGLWSVGPSTFYRYLQKGKRLMAQRVLDRRAERDRVEALRGLAQDLACQALGLSTAEARRTWHLDNARQVLRAGDAASALWHLLHGREVQGFLDTLQKHRLTLARSDETDGLLRAFEALSLDPRARMAAYLSRADICRARGSEGPERMALDSALQVASEAADTRLLGMAYAALGSYFEQRDADRSFACYEDAVRFLQAVPAADRNDAEVAQLHLTTIVRLAWMYLVRSDPRARVLLDNAEAMRAAPMRTEEAVAMLEQTWGEYWRRSGDLRRALECKHRALNAFERLGDRRSVLITYLNLSLIYGEAKDFDRALQYGQSVLDAAGAGAVEPQILLSTRGNLGAALFWQGRFDEAIDQYQRVLALCAAHELQVHAGMAHYNLAEAYYHRFKLRGDPEDERLGDLHAGAVGDTQSAQRNPTLLESSRNLKAEVLGARGLVDRLLPEEFAVHFSEMADVQRQRAVLAVPASPEVHVSAHLAIAQAYVSIAAKEREAAQGLVERHGLAKRFDAEFQALQESFSKTLSHQEAVDNEWRRAAADLVGDNLRPVVLRHLLGGGALTKSAYAELCHVALATASKHLGVLAERGLLVQAGRGPSTRYLLPEARFGSASQVTSGG